MASRSTSNNNNPTRRPPYAAPASAAPAQRVRSSYEQQQQTPRGVFALPSSATAQRRGAQTSPPKLRTPRASLAVMAAAAARSPALTPAQLQQNQLVKTPSTMKQLRKAGGADRPRWRASLAGAVESEAARKLAERREIVRGPATDALEQLLMVGRDATGEENGDFAVGADTEKLVAAFQGLKAAYLSDSPFLETSSIAHVVPQEVNNPSSPLNALVRLSNLTTFLNLVLTAAPDPESGVSSRAAVSQLKQAGDALLRHVKPPQDAVSDAALRLLVDIKCQTYIAAASTSRTAVDPVPYFSAPLSSHLPHAASIAMTDRAASVKFSTMQATALSTIQSTEGDWLVLRTKWTWEATAREARDWVESVVIDNGLGANAGLQDEDDAPAGTSSFDVAQSLSTGGSPRGQPSMQLPSTGASVISDDQIEAGSDAGDEDDLFGTQAALQRQSQAAAAAADHSVSDGAEQDAMSSSSSSDEQEELVVEQVEEVEEVVEIEASGGEESEEQLVVGPADEADVEDQLEAGDGVVDEDVEADENEQSQDELDQDLEADETAMLADNLSDAEAAAAALTAEEAAVITAAAGAQGQATALQRQQRDVESSEADESQIESFLALFNNPRDEEVQNLLDAAQAADETLEAEHVADEDAMSHASEEEQYGPSRPLSDVSSAHRPVQPDRNPLESEFFDMLDETLETREASPSAPAQDARPSEEQLIVSGGDKAAKGDGVLRFGPGNKLYRDTAPQIKSSLLDRQADAEKIEFDTQSIGDDQAPVAGPSGLSRAEKHSAMQAGSASPEQPHGQGRRFDSPVAHAHAAQESLDDETLYMDRGRNAAAERVPLLEPDHFQEEFGGGFDDEEQQQEQELELERPVPRQAAKKPAPTASARRRSPSPPPRRRARSPSLPLSRPKPSVPLTVVDAFVATQPTRRQSGSKRKQPVAADFDGTDSSSSSSDDAVVIRTSSTTPRRRASTNRPVKRPRHQRLPSEDELESPPPSRSQSRNPAATAARTEGTGNIYYQGRNTTGGRIPWSDKETAKLHELLEAFGADWKRMMLLHGPNGTESKIFRHRNNVSLKDKAVNERLQYEKVRAKVPGHLTCVTVPQSKLPRVAPQIRRNQTDSESE